MLIHTTVKHWRTHWQNHGVFNITAKNHGRITARNDSLVGLAQGSLSCTLLFFVILTGDIAHITTHTVF